MDLEREETENKVAMQRENVGDIKFENVTFRYGSRTEVFKNFNAIFKENETTAVLGESGSVGWHWSIKEGKIYIGEYVGKDK